MVSYPETSIDPIHYLWFVSPAESSHVDPEQDYSLANTRYLLFKRNYLSWGVQI